MLNQRAAQLVGRVVVLETALVDGFGKIRLGDALWTVTGADLPVGTRVVIEATDGINLSVRRAA